MNASVSIYKLRLFCCRVGQLFIMLGGILFAIPSAQAGLLDDDPIHETQTKPVAVTEETLKTEGMTSAPAPSFQLVEETDQFLAKPKTVAEQSEETMDESVEDDSLDGWEWLFEPEEKNEYLLEQNSD